MMIICLNGANDFECSVFSVQEGKDDWTRLWGRFSSEFNSSDRVPVDSTRGSLLNSEPPFGCETCRRAQVEPLRAEWLNTSNTGDVETMIKVDSKLKQISKLFG